MKGQDNLLREFEHAALYVSGSLHSRIMGSANEESAKTAQLNPLDGR